jgi:hypothetical protein
MAFEAKDGSKHGNKQRRDTYDRAKAPKKAESEPKGEESGGEGGEMGGDIHEMVAQHGPAEHVEIEHHEGGHTKTSMHGGNKHVSHHGSAMEAHQAGMTAAEVEPMQQEQPAQPVAMAGGMGGGIPGM